MRASDLPPSFVIELFTSCFHSSRILGLCIDHLKYEYLPEKQDHLSKLLKAIRNYYLIYGDVPTVGQIAGMLQNERTQRNNPQIDDALELLEKIKVTTPPDVEKLIPILESYIKDGMSRSLYKVVGGFFNENKKEEGQQYLIDAVEELKGFSFDSLSHSEIITGMKGRHNKRYEEREGKVLRGGIKKAKYGIDVLDAKTYGGVDYGDTALFIVPSGGGKTTALRHIGTYNARLGKHVVHIQLEGGKKEAEDGYDACLLGLARPILSEADIAEDKLRDMDLIAREIKGRIHIIGYDQMGKVSMSQIRASCLEIEKVYGPIEVLLLDYLEKGQPSSGRRYPASNDGEKMRRDDLAEEYKNLCVELYCAGFTGTQALTVIKDLRNDPTFVYGREHTRGSKNLVDPFSDVFTFNRTDKEKRERILRIAEDKLRYHFTAGDVHTIYTAFANSRFYDKMATLKNVGI